MLPGAFSRVEHILIFGLTLFGRSGLHVIMYTLKTKEFSRSDNFVVIIGILLNTDNLYLNTSYNYFFITGLMIKYRVNMTFLVNTRIYP